MKRKGRVIAVFSAVVALALLGALYWHSAGPAGSGRVGLQPEEMTKIVAGFKPKPTPVPTPTPDPNAPNIHITVERPAQWQGEPWVCSVVLRDPNGATYRTDPACDYLTNGDGYVDFEHIYPSKIGRVEVAGTTVDSVTGRNTKHCSGARDLGGQTYIIVPCKPD